MSKNLTKTIVDGIKAFYDFNGKKFFPENIIIYRDGVG